MTCLIHIPQRSQWNANSLSLSLGVCLVFSLLAVGSSTIGSPAEMGSIEFYGDGAPVETSDKTPPELSNSGRCGPTGCDIAPTVGTASQAVVRPDRIRSATYIEQVIQNAKLPDMTESYDMIRPLHEDSAGLLYMLVNEGLPYVLKLYRYGLTRQNADFQNVLLQRTSDAESKAHPGYAAVYHATMPVAWATHMGKKGLVFRYVVQPRKSRQPTREDRAQVRHQIDFLHWLGYVHLDITEQNIMLADNGTCYLMDYDCVCKIGQICLDPVPKESSEPIMRRDPAHLDDDDHLWQHLQNTFFKDLPADEAQLAPVQQQESAF